MSEWPATRVTLLDRLHDPQDQEAWAEFVALYGQLVFNFARRRLSQDEDAADVMQEVLSAVMRGTYQRPKGRFQKWLVTVLLNKIRNFHAAQVRRGEVCGDPGITERLQEEPSRSEQEWDQERERHLFRVAADRVQARTNPVHWDVFVRTALLDQSGQEVASILDLSLSNVYAIKSRLMKEIREEIYRLQETSDFTPEDIVREIHEDYISRKPPMTACIHIERMMHRSSIAVSGESVAGYTLLKLIPSGLGAAKPLALNLALALDVSGSMYEEDGTGVSRLQRVQEAALGAIEKLRPQDTLAIIGFAHNAAVLLPPTPRTEKDKIEDVLRRIDRFEVDPGGTAMDEGMALALRDIEQHAGPGKLSQIVVLTDGETSGEQNCRTLARQAAAKKIHLTFMGVGLDWKASLIKDLANLGQGKWYYIDVNDAKETTRIFAAEFETLAATAFLDVEMRLRPMKDVGIKRMRQVVPEIKDMPLKESEERNLVAKLGTLQHDTPARYILDLNLPKRTDGKYAIAQLELTYDLGTGRRESSGPIPLEINYTAAGNGYVNGEVMKHIDEIQLKDMSDVLQIALQNNDQEAAREVAQEMVKKSEGMGERGRKKTQLANKVLEELGASNHVTKRTQLALDNAARQVDENGLVGHNDKEAQPKNTA